MISFTLSDDEAKTLIAMEKRKVSDERLLFPPKIEKVVVDIVSINARESFKLDLVTGKIDLEKMTYQKRFRQSIPLIRLDLDGPEHVNPDRTVIECPHIHYYRSGFGVKWAQPIDRSVFSDISDLWSTLHDFLRHCNIVDPPNFEKGLLP